MNKYFEPSKFEYENYSKIYRILGVIKFKKIFFLNNTAYFTLHDKKQMKMKVKKMIIKEKKYTIEVNNYEFEGFIDEHRCNECNNPQLYYDKYDAYFCPNCNIWKEKSCDDPECEYCRDRPSKPLTQCSQYEIKEVYKIFLGKWKDEYNRVLELRINNSGEIIANYLSNEGESFERHMLTSVDDTLAMNTYYDKDNMSIIVELGTNGLGPTLKLDYLYIDEAELLIPTIHHGLYDDYDKYFGVKWLFPLREFKRV